MTSSAPDRLRPAAMPTRGLGLLSAIIASGMLGAPAARGAIVYTAQVRELRTAQDFPADADVRTLAANDFAPWAASLTMGAFEDPQILWGARAEQRSSLLSDRVLIAGAATGREGATQTFGVARSRLRVDLRIDQTQQYILFGSLTLGTNAPGVGDSRSSGTVRLESIDAPRILFESAGLLNQLSGPATISAPINFAGTLDPGHYRLSVDVQAGVSLPPITAGVEETGTFDITFIVPAPGCAGALGIAGAWALARRRRSS